VPAPDRPADPSPTSRVSPAARQLLGRALRRGAQRLDDAQARLLDDAAAAPAAAGQPGVRRADASPRGAGARPGRGGRRARPAGGAGERRPEDGGPAIAAARETLFRTLESSGELGLSATTSVRALLSVGAGARARTFAQVLQQQSGAVREIGDVCMAMTAVAAELWQTAWTLFTGVDPQLVLRWAPAEYLRTAFAHDAANAADALARLLAAGTVPAPVAEAWLDMARTSFVAGYDDLARASLDRAAAAATGETPDGVRADVEWLRDWLGRRDTATLPAEDVPAVGVLSFRSPERKLTSRNLGDYLESLAALSLVARRADIVAAGGLEPIVGEVRRRLDAAPGNAAPQDAGPRVTVHTVDRDATTWSPTPERTWTFVTGVLPQPVFGTPAVLPFPARIRPVFLSVHADSARTLTPEVLDYLRRHAPIGCRDWSTTLLLQAAGVPAFFAGAVTTTLAGLATRSPGGADLLVDVDGPGAVWQNSDAVRRREPAQNLRAALDHLDTLAGAGTVRTSRLQTYLAARAVGTPVSFQPANPSQRRLFGLRDLDDARLADMQRQLPALVGAVLDAIASGGSDDEVYAAWREACAPAVAAAEARRRDVAPLPPPAIDVAKVCATIRAGSVTVERSVSDRHGAEINVELSLDGNYKHQLEVVLDSIVVTTTRPVRAFVLCRDHTPADHQRMAGLFPEVSFVWLPTDSVDYGPISGLLGYTTVATMDRLLLPELLPELQRIVHHDLDALCLWDLGELHDVDFAGTPLAGRRSPQQSHVSGFASLMRRAERFPNDPGRGNEFTERTCARLDFDYDILNAGIMALDLDRMRADEFCRRFLPYVERFGLNDQAVLNVYVGRNRVEVDPGWNWRPWLERLPEPKIAHWAGEFKPWKPGWVVGRELWQAAEARVEQRYARAGLPPRATA
jgi:lipopolysaccharide biosynthesis glycosyltransferase